MTTGGVLGVIPARGGSKGVPGKNLRLLGGRSLLAYAADAARESGVIDRLVLSTDDAEIAEAGRGLNLEVPFVRPPSLATDDAPMLPVVQHAVEALMTLEWVADIVVLLQPTSPLRTPGHIRRAVAMLRESGADSVITVVAVPRHLSPDYLMRMDGDRLVPFLSDRAPVSRRQDARQAYVRDGTVYACWRKTLDQFGSIYGIDSRPLVLESRESLSIDSLDDWDEAERRVSVRS